MFSRLSSMWSMLTTDPLGFVLWFIYLAVTILISLILHEVAHGWVAWKCGDPTAKMYGRLSLDPRKHLDPVGTVSMLLFGIGWARPVPVNPRNFRHYRQDDLKVSLAGIAMNLALFFVSLVISVALVRPVWGDRALQMIRTNFGGADTLVNIYKNSGSIAAGIVSYTPKEMMEIYSNFAGTPWLLIIQKFFLMMAQINLSLAVFNLIPIPPLDGYHVLNDTILKGRWDLTPRQFQIVQLILIGVMVSGIMNRLLTVVNGAVFSLFSGILLRLAGL